MPGGRQRNIRKRKAEPDSDVDEEQQEASARERLEATKLLQQQRSRLLGVDSSSLAAQRDTLSTALERTGEPASRNDMLEAFSKEQTKDEIEQDPHMQKYIDEQMTKRLGWKKQEDEGKRGPFDPMQALYVTPDELKIDPVKSAEVPGSWLTGISEVQIAAHHKLKNIEETEAVKQRLLQPDAKSDEDSDYAPAAEPEALPRGAFPRGFGREGDKLAAVRKTNLERHIGGGGGSQAKTGPRSRR